MITIDIIDDGLNAALQKLAAELAPVFVAASVATAEATRDLVAPYPGARRKRQPFKTDKQRRGFFAKLRKGAIRVPYRRTGDALNRWQVPEIMSNGAIIRNTSPHAIWIHSERRQAAYHAGNWKTDAWAMKEIEDNGTAVAIFEDAITVYLGGN